MISDINPNPVALELADFLSCPFPQARLQVASLSLMCQQLASSLRVVQFGIVIPINQEQVPSKFPFSPRHFTRIELAVASVAPVGGLLVQHRPCSKHMFGLSKSLDLKRLHLLPPALSVALT